jgi:hypothetical protein
MLPVDGAAARTTRSIASTAQPGGPRMGLLRHRHDPFWDDGVGARHAHVRARIEAMIAFALAIGACGLTTAMWLRTLATSIGHGLG